METNRLPKSWCVQRTKDNKEKFMKHVLPYLNELLSKTGNSADGNSINSYYGVTKSGATYLFDTPNEFETVLTVEEFIELTQPLYRLPKVWCIDVRIDNEKVMQYLVPYLNKYYNAEIASASGGAFPFYGVSDSEKWNLHICPSKFGNNVVLLTIDEFINLTTQTQFNMENELKITREKVLEAANKCEASRETLKTLFPEVFVDDKYFDLSKLEASTYCQEDGSAVIFTDSSARKAGLDSSFIQISRTGNTYNKGFFLYDIYNWEIVTNNLGDKVLIPTKK